MRSIAVLLLLAAGSAFGQVRVEKPWARATAPGAQVAGAYMVLRNQAAAPDRLVGASSPAAARVELHVHIREGDVMKMRQVPAYDVPANGTFELKPGGAHLMFFNIARPFKEGDRIPVKLKFEKAGEVSAEFHVGRLVDSGPPPAHKH